MVNRGIERNSDSQLKYLAHFFIRIYVSNISQRFTAADKKYL